MKRRSNNGFIAVAALIVLISIWVYTTDIAEPVLKAGKYTCEHEGVLDWAWVELTPDGNYTFSRGLALSYRPEGKYEVRDNNLYLKVDDREDYVFEITEEGLLFKYEGDSKVYNALGLFTYQTPEE